MMKRRDIAFQISLAALILWAATPLGATNPNPFTDVVRITLTIPDGYSDLPIRITVYDLSGRMVKTLANEPQGLSAGLHRFEWKGDNDRGDSMPAGVYLCVLQAGGEIVETVKLVKVAR